MNDKYNNIVLSFINLEDFLGGIIHDSIGRTKYQICCVAVIIIECNAVISCSCSSLIVFIVLGYFKSVNCFDNSD